MSEADDEAYSIEESSGYSYQDLAIYQFSDAEDDPPKRPTSVFVDDDDEDGEWNQWNDYDNESFVMHVQSDNDDDIDLYQFSDEDLIPEEPSEEWIVAALLNNRSDFENLELMLETLEDFPRLIEALQSNRIVKNVTIYEQFFDSLITDVQTEIFAETVCRLQSLQNLKVYYQAGAFVGPLARIRPPFLKKLSLMFFPDDQPKPQTLATLTQILKDGYDSPNEPEEGGGDAPTSSTPPPNPSPLDSLSLRCNIMNDDFIRAIANGMEVNPAITTLSFWGNKVQVSEAGAHDSARIDFYLRLNQCQIRDVHLLVNATPAEFLDKIVSERESIDLVFYLLQTNPSFLSYSTFLEKAV